MSSQGGGSTRMGSLSGGSIGYAYPLDDNTSYYTLDDSDTTKRTTRSTVTASSAGGSSRHNHKAIYERAQLSSSSQVGSSLYNSGNNFGRRRPNRALRFTSAQTPSQSQHLSSSLQSSLNSSFGGGHLSSSFISTTSSSRQPSVMLSMSGNPLHKVHNENPEELELDKDELKKMIIAEDETSKVYGKVYNHQHRSVDAASVALSSAGGDASASVITPLATSSTYENSYTSSHPLVNQILKITQSQQFQRSLFLALLFTLMAIGTFLTIENVIHVKDANAWIEPNNKDIGINWSMGNDAPQPIRGIAAISPEIQDYIADWAVGTSFITGVVDNYGSITLTETTKFRDIPLFWGSEYADSKGIGGGNSIMESVLGCLNLVQVSSAGLMENDNESASKNVDVGDKGGANNQGEDYLHLSVVMSMGRKYINVDTTTKDGIERAKVLALGSSGMADVIYSSLLQDVSSLFTTLNQGRMFVLIRHPIEREMARFRYLRRGQYERTKLTDWQRGKLQDMSYLEFAQSEFARDNWMTRELVNKRCINGKDEDGEACAPLDDTDVHTAKEILRRKALIGLYGDIMGAVQHYGRYFGWDKAQKGGSFDDATMSCFQNHILEGMREDALGGKDLDPNDTMEHSDAYVTLMEKNRFDFELFTYSQTLYKYQVQLS